MSAVKRRVARRRLKRHDAGHHKVMGVQQRAKGSRRKTKN